MTLRAAFLIPVLLALGLFGCGARSSPAPAVERDGSPAHQRLAPKLERAGVALGAPVYLRIFKQERVLELWMAGADGAYSLVESYPICAFSGGLGPKLKEGDRQAPEGFYRVTPGLMNPNSRFHLSFNLGFPNAYDRAHGRTGSFLMVHGDCVSIGCYAMTDPVIEELWLVMRRAFDADQAAVPVHAFPFRPTETAMAALAERDTHPWAAFWRELAPAYTLFEQTGRVPKTALRGTRYLVAPGD